MDDARRACLVAAAALAAAAAMAWPVVIDPGAMLIGSEIAGPHHDPITVMTHWMHGGAGARYWQPVTDIPGAFAARLFGPVAAYNLIVGASFPLTAAATYLLARYLQLSAAAAAAAGLFFALAPIRLAHAAYHPHLTQTHWLALYLLALFACVDGPSMRRAALLAAAAACVVFSNLYGGVVAAVITMAALPAYWRVRSTSWRPVRRFWIPAGVLTGCGAAIAAWSMPMLTPARAHPAGDLVRYGAAWWAYLVPAADHALLGRAATALWHRAGVDIGILEQQVAIGATVLLLAIAGVRSRLTPAMPCVAIVAAWAWTCSLAPGSMGPLPLPADLIGDIAPAFRAPARFGIAVALMMSLAAGCGFARILSAPSRRRLTAPVLIALAIVQIAPWDPRGRDVLPTSAHRWIARQPAGTRALDCTAATQADASLPALFESFTMRAAPLRDCRDPNIAFAASVLRYTHLIVRRSEPIETARALMRAPGLRLLHVFSDARIFAIDEALPPVATIDMPGFHDRERDGRASWRWMPAAGWWHIANRTHETVRASLVMDWSGFNGSRPIEIALDGRRVAHVTVPESRTVARIGPLTVPPGNHQLGFRSTSGAAVADAVDGNGDPRALSIRLHAWRWEVDAS